MRSHILKKNRDKKLKQSKDDIKLSFYGSGCGHEPIFEVEWKIIAKNIKFTLKGCVRVGHNNCASNHCYWWLYQKKVPKQTHPSLVDNLIEQIPDLDIHKNYTSTGLPFLFWSNNPRSCMDPLQILNVVWSTFWGYYSQCSVLTHNQIFLSDQNLPWSSSIFMVKCSKCTLIENNHILHNKIYLTLTQCLYLHG